MKLDELLVSGWRQSWRWFSVQLHVIATLLGGLLLMMPQMPAEVQAVIPAEYRAVAIALWLALGLFARLKKQGG